MIKHLTVDDIEHIAHSLAIELMQWNEPIPPFNTRFPEKLESCINTVSQSFDGKPFYSTIEEKAGVLFYLMIKNHPFQNGNKRLAVTTTLVFLQLNDKWLTIDAKRLYNFAIWVAESDPLLNTETIAATTSFIKKNLTS